MHCRGLAVLALICCGLGPAAAQPASLGLWDDCVSSMTFRHPAGVDIVVASGGQISGPRARIPAGDPLCVGFILPNGRLKPLLQAGGAGGNAFTVELSTGLIQVIESVEVSPGRSFSFARRAIECREGACRISEEACAVHPGKPDASIIQDVGKAAEDGGNLGLASAASLSARLLLNALTGDQESARLLKQPPFQLDAAPAEVWASAEETLERARNLDCPGLRR
jgi:hypothetical protein